MSERTTITQTGFNQIIPVDVLLEIVGHLHAQDVWEDSFSNSKLAPGRMHSPLIRAAAVCRCWREVIHSTSSLWSHIFLVDSNPTALRDYLEWQMNLAQHQPLHIVNKLEGSQDVFSDDIIRLLLLSSHLWTSLDLTAPLSVMKELFSATSAPQLKNLRLWVIRVDKSEDLAPISPIAIQAPQLSHVSLHNVDGLPFSLPWSQLKSLSCDTTYGFKTLPLLHDVERLEMYWKDEDFVDAWNQPGIQLPCLRHVDLDCYDTSSFLDTVESELRILPSSAVKTIGISLLGVTNAWDFSLLKKPTIPFTLTTLHISEYLPYADDMLVPVLCGLRGLMDFRIDDGGNANVDRLLDELCHHDQFLPVLEQLNLQSVRFSFDKGKEMVNTRVGRPASFGKQKKSMRSVRIVQCYEPGDDINKRGIYNPDFGDGTPSVYIGMLV